MPKDDINYVGKVVNMGTPIPDGGNFLIWSFIQSALGEVCYINNCKVVQGGYSEGTLNLNIQPQIMYWRLS